ncbi:MAG: hypothetical protein ABFS38_22545 [Bacteroidota bacterium]
MLWVLSGLNLEAQTGGSGYVDMGSNNVSNGFYLKTAALVQYQFGKNSVATGLQLDLKSNNSTVFSGYSIRGSRDLQVKGFPFELQGFGIWTPYAGLLRETNWGMSLSIRQNHFSIQLGTGFRSIAFTQKSIDTNMYEKGERIRENWNLLYSAGYHLKPLESHWNIGLTVTNLDHFLVNQETNPIFNLRGHYRISLPLDLFMEAWYKSAGAFNLSVNYFGFFIRTGIVWEIQ